MNDKMSKEKKMNWHSVDMVGGLCTIILFALIMIAGGIYNFIWTIRKEIREEKEQAEEKAKGEKDE